MKNLGFLSLILISLGFAFLPPSFAATDRSSTDLVFRDSQSFYRAVDQESQRLLRFAMQEVTDPYSRKQLESLRGRVFTFFRANNPFSHFSSYVNSHGLVLGSLVVASEIATVFVVGPTITTLGNGFLMKSIGGVITSVPTVVYVPAIYYYFRNRQLHRLIARATDLHNIGELNRFRRGILGFPITQRILSTTFSDLSSSEFTVLKQNILQRTWSGTLTGAVLTQHELERALRQNMEELPLREKRDLRNLMTFLRRTSANDPARYSLSLIYLLRTLPQASQQLANLLAQRTSRQAGHLTRVQREAWIHWHGHFLSVARIRREIEGIERELRRWMNQQSFSRAERRQARAAFKEVFAELRWIELEFLKAEYRFIDSLQRKENISQALKETLDRQVEPLRQRLERAFYQGKSQSASLRCQHQLSRMPQ